jgi:hypothetical protein
MKEMTLGNLGVQPLDRASLRYREGTRTMRIGGQMQLGDPDYTVFTFMIGVWDDTGEAATPEERRVIIENIRRVFEHNGRKVEFC